MANIYLEASDFGDITVDEVKCRGCNGPLCGDKTPKLYEGDLIFVCHLGDAGNAVLARAAQRLKQSAREA